MGDGTEFSEVEIASPSSFMNPDEGLTLFGNAPDGRTDAGGRTHVYTCRTGGWQPIFPHHDTSAHMLRE